MSYQRNLRDLEEAFEDPDVFDSWLLELDFSQLLDAETIAELAFEAMDKNTSTGKFVNKIGRAHV